MKNTIAAITITALLATQAMATDIPEPQPEPESSGSSSSSSDFWTIVVVAIVGATILHYSKPSQSMAPPQDLSEPRPTVRPDCQLNKLGNVVACQ